MNHPFIEMYNKRWKNHTFFFKEELSEECWKDVEELCRTNDKRLGYYIYSSHIMKDGELIFDGMKVAYYVRNPLHKWRKYKVYYS
jgi:hypothetical protein